MSRHALPKDHCFVFGSNLAGIHGAGSAKAAYDHHGAEWGKGYGPMGGGRCYGIPTKAHDVRTRLELDDIAAFVDDFFAYAVAHPHITFHVVAIGTGLAGYRHEQMAPLFHGMPEHVVLPEAWGPWLDPRPCPRCLARGQTWAGDAPNCGFKTGLFDSDNWNCATLNALREAAATKNQRVYGDDVSCATLWTGFDMNAFVVLTWYKNRGRTTGAVVVSDHNLPVPLRLKVAEAALAEATR
jgi:hypothetical protein